MKRIYFVRPIGMDGPVKIGCSIVPESRLHALWVWSPFPLEIVASIDGDFGLESKIHAHFAATHSHREWFRASPELTKLISDLHLGVPLDLAIDFRPGQVSPVKRGGKGSRTKGYFSYNRAVRSAAAIAGIKIPVQISEVLERMAGKAFYEADITLIELSLRTLRDSHFFPR